MKQLGLKNKRDGSGRVDPEPVLQMGMGQSFCVKWVN
jgi:hypothetical protein